MLRLVASQRGIAALKAAAKLSRDHAAALWLYTCESALYRKLNELLRARNRAALMAGFFPYLRLLLEAFAALETPTPRMVNRGVARDLVAAHPELYAKGSELTWWGFSSTTKDIAVLQARRSRANTAVVCVPAASIAVAGAEPDVPRLGRRPHDLPDPHAPRHRHLAVLSGAPSAGGAARRARIGMPRQVEGEAELLLPAGIALKITGVLPRDASGLTIITCEDDDDAPALIS